MILNIEFHIKLHLIARCSFDKVRSKKSPSWWLGVLDHHYMVQNVSKGGGVVVCSAQIDNSLAVATAAILEAVLMLFLR